MKEVTIQETEAFLPTNIRDSVRRTAFDIDHSQFALPSVTVFSEAHNRRRERNLRVGSLTFWFRVGIIVIPFIYIRRINYYLQYLPQTISAAPILKNDYSIIQSPVNLTTDHVRPWCWRAGMDCSCRDPLKPQSGTGSAWPKVHLSNQARTQSERALDVDVVFYGDSIIEQWSGRDMGVQKPGGPDNWQVFQSLFDKRKGANYSGLPMGIAGDTSPMLLWRLRHGELPSNLNPSVFWVLIGTNDIGRTWCSPELVVIGVLINVEEILAKKPNAQVVIQGLLPRTYNAQGYVARGGTSMRYPSVWADIQHINAGLRQYAEKRDRVSYFETNLFFIDTSVPEAELVIDQDLMADFLHPTAQGYQLWGEEIVQYLNWLLAQPND
eukprot:Nitzschia sp. Nitz4//scaffold35_size145790//40807//42165//NITZ4_003018-RA/size145790-augustus-gene-0.114-mRNA-1//1//CDS//3329549088//5306//frame0